MGTHITGANPPPMPRRRSRRKVPLLALVLACGSLAGRASAHGLSLAAGTREPLTVPTWLFLTTGGATVGASFLLASFVTDRSFIASIHEWRTDLSHTGLLPRSRARSNRSKGLTRHRLLSGIVSVVGLVGLVAVVVIGFIGPETPAENASYLLVWVGWWAGFTMSTYLVGNSWPALNPWRTIASVLPTFDRPYPDRFGAWPATVGLIALVYLEIVGPPVVLSGTFTPPSFIATLAIGYSIVTFAGTIRYGDAWFDRADPVSHVFQYYGRVAPFSYDRPNSDGGFAGEGTAETNETSAGFHARLPGMALSRPHFVDGPDEVAFVVALLWATTYDGLVATPFWADLLRPLNVSGLTARIVYLVVMIVGFVLFLTFFRLAVRASREMLEAHVTRAELAARFTPPLLAIAAGYHLAHYLGYFLSLSPALVESLLSPLSASGSYLTLTLPEWFGGVGLASVLAGHVLAIWVTHSSAYDRFPSRLQAIRSQYPIIAVMILYTMTSLWILSQPTIKPPYV